MVNEMLHKAMEQYLALNRAQKYQMRQKKHGLHVDFKKSYRMSYLKRRWKVVMDSELRNLNHKWKLVMSVPIRTTPTRIRFK